MSRAYTFEARRLVGLACVIACGLACGLGGACRGLPDPALTQLWEARRVAAELHVQFIKAADASDRAVMADTDESSVLFAHEADAAAQSVQSGMAELGTRLGSLGYADEARTLDGFSRCFAEYQKVDHDVLALAVENTNLKAQRLSFGPVREAADAFRDALEDLAKSASPKDRARDEATSLRAILAVRDIQILQAPHIAEADDASMSRIEAGMAAREATAREALKTLGGRPETGAALAAATGALDRFEKLSTELIALSRRNTNVKSLALSLKPKPALTATCDASLEALETALAKRGFTATR
jgi:hypothetical protein